MKFFKLFIALFISLLFITDAQSVTAPSKQQIEQLKKLPKSQQEALAKKYGFDLSALNSETNATKNADSENVESVLPRETLNIKEKEEVNKEEKFKPKSTELEPFGYELFSGQPTTFAPTESALVPDDYIVGPGDSFSINLYGKEYSSEEVTVNREGRLVLQNLSPVNVAGLKYKEVVELIKLKIQQEVIGVKAFVSMGKTRSIRVMVLGESFMPGAYTVPSLSSITHAIFVSGGISKIGSLRHIQLKRGGKVVSELDLYDLLIKGDSSGDVILKPGDVVFIPPVGKQVSIKGAVKRPAIFELEKTETINDLITMAGGYTANANSAKTVVERYTEDSFKTVIPLDISLKANTHLRTGDVITVPSSSGAFDNSVTLLGAVTYPGNYAWSEGKKVKDLFSSLKSDLLPIADFDYALILREINEKSDIEVYQFSLIDAFNNDPKNNLALKADDVIVVFSRFQTKVDESNALKSLALTEEQLAHQKRVELWNEFEKQEFYKFVNFIDDESLDQELSETNSSLAANADNISKLLNAQESDLKEADYAVFSRKKLLKPIIAKLNEQSSHQNKIKVFGIRGEVKYAGLYPLPVNATVNKAVVAAGGLNESSYLGRAEITRFTNNENIEHVNIDLSDALDSNQAASFAVQSKDSISVYPIPNWQSDLRVRIAGEVKFPGVYSIRKGEDLTSVIKRAGGFTKFAYPEGAVFTRQAIREKEQRQIDKLAQDLRRSVASQSFTKSITQSNLNYADMDKLISDLGNIKSVGRLVIDLPAVEKGVVDLTLQNNDALYIPRENNNISVVGEVNFSTSHLFDSRLTLQDYINRSGGFKAGADEERLYIIKASGLVVVPEQGSWFAVADDATLSPGDTIVVPLDTDQIDNLTLWSTATQIIYQMGVAVAAISSL
ncbi:SLBB domain-containing protein [Pseudoalteromonas apostichopi]|uniref:SLBB domain-containing protein n=1 Tax=Pseudoalteromonas apostichopi TaxID=3035452 RepID=UPI0025747F93|nr:SLBB domain-containing protein [Pseudoalteromonas sp. FE4]